MRPSEPTARSLIVDLLATLQGGSMPVAALVAAGRIFDLSDGRIRVALTRLCARGLVERDERGRYRPGAASAAVGRHVAVWRRAQDEMGSWHGDWIAANCSHGASRSRGAQAHDRALQLLGFSALDSGLQLRPNNLRAGVAGVRDQLHELGLNPGTLVFRLAELDSVSNLRAHELWPVESITAGYREHLQQLDASTRRIDRLSREEAMAESFMIGGAVLRAIILDPLLPDPIVHKGALAELITAMRAYDRKGRSCWADFLASHGVAHRRAPAAPADLRGTPHHGADRMRRENAA